MARHYKQVARYELRDLLLQFNCQRVPAVLFNYSLFNERWKGSGSDEVSAGVSAETDLTALPQVVHVASCVSFDAGLRQVCDEGRCMVAHTFENGVYTDAREVVWLVGEIDAKQEVASGLAELWADRLEKLAAGAHFRRHQIWLISNEGFTEEASGALERRGVLSSSRQQVDQLFELIGAQQTPIAQTAEASDEFLVVVPMGEDNELLAASTVEQIARRLSFRPEAINQIKTAIVEACINASEHSFSPDRKIYQRYHRGEPETQDTQAEHAPAKAR